VKMRFCLRVSEEKYWGRRVLACKGSVNDRAFGNRYQFSLSPVNR
jgi:hypothetical protein